ncbi:efflux transporter, RND family, MFP subunit [Asticcacaulis biprosthecium C19]|uniref:Efflux transporter, RND family, MFP subunit n=1 Tax=Asticcacaulis biprosthecium C19 TaxID=715226 RepID=F4QTF1_9CAUL|nr:efflux RND transporter periplasmic adaptor subunit [Asticcacaulis biprosthecium]EGF90021.1 efflux transporter, RND family, MFP subunit [Asticcacaulis biprosthecium C19]
MPRRLLPALLLTASLMGLVACGDKPEPPVAEKAAGHVFTAARTEVDDLKPIAGTLTSYKMAEASARLSGTLVDLRVREGDVVQKGQLIGRVQDSKIAPQTSAYSAQAAAADAQTVQARAQYNRVKTLFDKGIYAQAALDQAEAGYKSAEASARAAHAQVAASNAYGNEGAIYAPDSGRILRAPVPQGSVVMMGQSVATITAGEPVVRIELPEGQGRALKPGDTVELSVPGRTASGTITQVYPSVSLGQITADVTPSGLQDLPIGARVTAYIRLGRRPAVVLPRSYVQTRYGLDYVRLVQPDGHVVETTVETTDYDATQIEIIGGLNSGDRLAAYGGQ